MSSESVHEVLGVLSTPAGIAGAAYDRLRNELEFAWHFAASFPDQADEWRALVRQAAQAAADGWTAGGDPMEPVRRAEAILRPIGEAAKQCTVHCTGHAHIDMNWMWPWQETVSATHDTFTTVDKLMSAYPQMTFSQSQASCYIAMQEHCPDVFEMIRRRMREGRWENIASMWVEGDKNLASGEILCRHILYTRRYFQQMFGQGYDAVQLDFEPDTFGHAATLPTILNRAGIRWYYHCRTGPERWLSWWEAADGSRVLLFLDRAWYNERHVPNVALHFVEYYRENGLKDFLYVYGVGDHGGGPTRRQVERLADMDTWPIYPQLKFSTFDAYFRAVEAAQPDLPVVTGELNTIFEGCYTSQTNIKHANRVSECVIPEAEIAALIAGPLGFEYPTERLERCWQHAMFNQFHDILPGSGVHATYEYSQGLFQDILATTGAIRTAALRKLADNVDTASLGLTPGGVGEGLGAGFGMGSAVGQLTSWNAGAPGPEPVLVFNPLPFARSGTVTARVWDKPMPRGCVVVRDDQGNRTIGQVLDQGEYWWHNYTSVLFPAQDIPGTGYRTYVVESTPVPVDDRPAFYHSPHHDRRLSALETDLIPVEDTVSMPTPGVLENRWLRVEVDLQAAAVRSLFDKVSGVELVPDGERMGLLEFVKEAPNGMSAWDISPLQECTPLDTGYTCLEQVPGFGLPMEMGPDGPFPRHSMLQNGPHRSAVRMQRVVGESRVMVEIALEAGSRRVDFNVVVDWREVGTRATNIPGLRVRVPVNVADPRFTCEIPFGSIEREPNGREVPALKWADISGQLADGRWAGVTLVNADKYGHNADGNVLRLNLIRSTFNPDPLPELGRHEIRFSVCPHEGALSADEAVRAGMAFNQPLSVVSTDVHTGSLPTSHGFCEVLTPGVMVSGLKPASDGLGLIVRMWNTADVATTAQVRLRGIAAGLSTACETDLMEQPLLGRSAGWDGEVLTVDVPAFAFVTVLLT